MREKKYCVIIFSTLIMLLSSCKFALSNGIFVFEGIDEGPGVEDPRCYLTEQQYEQYRVAQVMIVPQIKVIGENECILDFILYAFGCENTITINQAELYHNGQIIDIPTVALLISLNKEEDDYYLGAERYYRFPANAILAENGEKYQLEIFVTVKNAEGVNAEKHLSYSVKVVQHLGLAFPT